MRLQDDGEGVSGVVFLAVGVSVYFFASVMFLFFLEKEREKKRGRRLALVS